MGIENENKIEVVEKISAKTIKETKKIQNKSTIEEKKQDVMLDNGVQNTKPSNHSEEKKVEVVEEPFIEEFAYQTTSQTNNVETKTIEKNIKQSSNTMKLHDKIVENKTTSKNKA